MLALSSEPPRKANNSNLEEYMGPCRVRNHHLVALELLHSDLCKSAKHPAWIKMPEERLVLSPLTLHQLVLPPLVSYSRPASGLLLSCPLLTCLLWSRLP